jgi:hypothetical protein
MPLSRVSVAGAVAWTVVCVTLLLFTEPWLGGDASLAFFFSLIFVSFPIGLVGAGVFGLATDLSRGTSFENYMCCTAAWWASYFALQLAFGYVQWFIVTPMSWRFVRRRMAIANVVSKPPTC